MVCSLASPPTPCREVKVTRTVTRTDKFVEDLRTTRERSSIFQMFLKRGKLSRGKNMRFETEPVMTPFPVST